MARHRVAPGEAAHHEPADARTRSGVERFRRLQQALKRRTNRHGLGPLPWPAALGTPPWGAARAARYADVAFVDRVVAGPGAQRVGRAALVAASRGVPVPLFTGGDVALGLATAVPRHVVLLTDADEAAGWCRVYEPSSGTLHTLPAGRSSTAPGCPRRVARSEAGRTCAGRSCPAAALAGRAPGGRMGAAATTVVSTPIVEEESR